jgi:predicted TPR repeat methyltransferase
VLSFFNKHSAKDYNWILAFDVFCYLGNLEAILKALKGIKFCFSIESGDEMRGQDYYLAPNGRYKHKISYVSGLFDKLKIKDVQTKKIVLRKENGNDVEGVLFYTL